MKKVIIILTLLAITTICFAQGDKTQPDMDSIKAKSLCILEETDKHIIYLTDIVRLVRPDEEQTTWYTGQFFLRYETWTVTKGDENRSIREQAILNGRIKWMMVPDGGDIHIAVYDNLSEGTTYYKNGIEDGRTEPTGEWIDAGNSTDNGIFSKIGNYFDEHNPNIPLVVEDLKRYDRLYAQ